MIKFSVILNNIGWKNYLKRPNQYIEKKLYQINKKNKNFKKKAFYCSLVLSGNSEIKRLNKKFRNKNKTTDVLSFPFHKKKELQKVILKENEIYLGDIIINLNKIKYKKKISSFKIEFDKLWIHGLVNLLGYDHKSDQDFNRMLRVEKKFLSYVN